MAIYPHRITAWVKEIDGRHAVWTRLVFSNCRLDEKQGTSRGVNGDDSVRQASLLMKYAKAPLKSGDRVFPGLSISPEPPSDAYVVQGVEAVCIGSTPDHWEVELY